MGSNPFEAIPCYIMTSYMLSRARYKEEILDSNDEDKEDSTILTTSITREGVMQFLEEEYEDEFKEIWKYLQTPDKYKG